MTWKLRKTETKEEEEESPFPSSSEKKVRNWALHSPYVWNPRSSVRKVHEKNLSFPCYIISAVRKINIQEVWQFFWWSRVGLA